MTCSKLRVAILGGGMSGLSAAYELSRTPALRARYDVTVHQMGFRLGGKLASGRNPHRGLRNEEHGLHVWFGFYENTFRLAREVYESWESPPDCPFASIWDFLKPQRHSVLGHEVEGHYRTVGLHFPRSLDVPGDGRALPSFLGLVTGVIDAARVIAGLVSRDAGRTGSRTRLSEVVWPERDAAIFARPGEMDPALVETLHRRLDLLARFLSTRFTDMPSDVRARLAEHTHRLLATAHPKIARALDVLTRDDPARRPLHYFVDTTLAFLRGLTNPADRIYIDGDLDRVSDRDFRTWLLENGCQAESTEKSPWIAAAYDSSFQFLGSDRTRPAFEAGTAARYAIRGYLLYKHAPGYVVDAGMGEAIVAPMYEVLKERGVRFQFFHRLARMELAPDGRSLARLHFVEQARTRGGTYQPLFTHQGLRCWSTEPDWSQLEDGEELRARGVDFESRFSAPGSDRPLALSAGSDFDVALVALPLGSIRADADGFSPCEEWMDAVPPVRAAAEGINLMTSVAAQLWFDRDMPTLGWERRPAVIGWAPPLGIWCDMTPTIAHEGWPADAAPSSVAYLCGVGARDAELASSSDREAPARARREAIGAIARQLETHGVEMWPGSAAEDGAFDWSTLFDPGGAAGPARLEAQLVKVHIEPWDLCDGAAPGNFRLRLAAHESGLDNVALAGTWTKTSVSTAAIETAVMSGIAAARAIGLEGRTIVGEGFMCKPAAVVRIAACTPRPEPAAFVASAVHVDA